MKVIEKPLIVGGIQVGNFLAYEDVEPELIVNEPGTRVLPAPFFYEKSLHFTLIKRFELGESKYFPLGGFTVRSEFGQVRNFELDQVILHPSIIKNKKLVEKMMKRAEKISKQKERKAKKEARANKPKYGHKGRPALSPEVKAIRDAEKEAKALRSSGKRGRPASTVPKVVKVRVEGEVAGKRGRPSLSAEQKLERERLKGETTARSGGKRGRPASAHPKPKAEPTGRGRGRPPSIKKKKGKK